MLEFLEKSVQSSPDIIVVCDTAGMSVWKNDEANASFTSDKVRDLFVNPRDFDLMLEAKFIGVSDKSYRLLNGWLAHTVAVSLDGDGRHFIIFRDITDLDLLNKEGELRERVKAVSGFANNVAFDIATPLTVLLGRLGFLNALSDSLSEGVNKQLKIINEHAKRISTTVSNLQIFAALDCEEFVLIAPPKLLERSVACIMDTDRTISIQCESQFGIRGPEFRIRGDETLLQQAFGALIMSVIQSANGAEIFTSTNKGQEAERVRFEFHGTGRNLPIDEGWERLESGSTQALGFGVSVAVIIFGYHSGSLYFRESYGSVSFRVDLPLEYSNEPEACYSGPEIRVLLVDDDQALLSLGQEILEMGGHVCDTVNNASDALILLGRQSYDVVVTDVGLPGMSGLALRERAVSNWPELRGKFVYVTGLSLSTTSGVRVLQKPFTPKQLIRVVLDIVG